MWFLSIPWYLVNIPKTPQRFSNWKNCSSLNKENITSYSVYWFCQAHQHLLSYEILLQLSNYWHYLVPPRVSRVSLHILFQQIYSIGAWACVCIISTNQWSLSLITQPNWNQTRKITPLSSCIWTFHLQNLGPASHFSN